MAEHYFLTFGVKDGDPDELAAKLENKIVLEYQKHSSDYIGNYVKYTSKLLDRFSIQPNFFLGEWKEEFYKDYNVLIYISAFKKGKKEQEKVDFLFHIKRILLDEKTIVLLSEKTVNTST